MSGGLGAYLVTHDDALVGLVIAGSLLAIAGMLLFLAIVARDARAGRGDLRSHRLASFETEAQTG